MTVPLTHEQWVVVHHPSEAFVEACPGAGKTRAIVARLSRLAEALPPRQGVAVLSFTNSAVEEFIERCHTNNLESAVRYPSFVGTFDSFLRQVFVAPSGIAGVSSCPTILDSWETLGVEVRLRGNNAFRGRGVSLDDFDAENNQIDPDLIGHAGLRASVRNNQAAYVHAAAQRRQALRSKGYLSSADVRVEALRRLQDRDWSSALGRALAARFHEVIVDEAQDCNPLDLKILRWLREHRLAVTIVADPDQAIYGFRHGDPTDLRQLITSYDPTNRLSLTGNFRSSPYICALAATLRDRVVPDESLGETASVREPIYLLEYNSAFVPDTIGKEFARMLRDVGIDSTSAIVLSHARRVAMRACGLGGASDAGGSSKVATIARAVAAFWSSSASNRGRETSLRVVERMILDLMGKIEGDEIPARAAERNGVERRWLRRIALQLVSRLPPSCEDGDEGRVSWLSTLHAEVRNLGLIYNSHTTERSYFRNPQTQEWSQHLRLGDTPELRCATVHEAKGREFDAVCLVIPPDRGAISHTTRLFDAWMSRSTDEGKRVIYVGVTRARKLVCLSIPSALKEQLVDILTGSGIRFALRSLDSTVAAPTPDATSSGSNA